MNFIKKIYVLFFYCDNTISTCAVTHARGLSLQFATLPLGCQASSFSLLDTDISLLLTECLKEHLVFFIFPVEFVLSKM